MGETKLHRNEPCWCGSGKKYKKCHLESDERKEAERNAPAAPRAREYFEVQRGVVGRQIRSDEVGPR
jgi:methionyl aminopeptidase